MKQKSLLVTRTHGLYRNPNNPFEAWDSEGRPCLPMTIDGESSSTWKPGARRSQTCCWLRRSTGRSALTRDSRAGKQRGSLGTEKGTQSAILAL